MKRRRGENLNKVTVYAIVINALQIAAMIAIVLYTLLTPSEQLNPKLLIVFLLVCAFIVIAGAAMDIRDAVSARKMMTSIDDMDQTIVDMGEMNNTLRAQRHDFLNHLQVVYSLMEMQEWQEAQSYIEKVYGDITSVSRVMKTANPAVNALLQVKLASAEKAGIRMKVEIRSPWKDLPIPVWSVCKVLANLIDNAVDALGECDRPDKDLTVELTEDMRFYRFAVRNNGPQIPEKLTENIFHAGITTKAAGHGMGLYIVRSTLREYGGDISVTSTAEETCFSGFFPKTAPQSAGDKPDETPKV